MKDNNTRNYNCPQDPTQRKTAAEMLQHPFVAGSKTKELLAELVAKCQSIAAQRGYGLYDDEDEASTFLQKELVRFPPPPPILFYCIYAC